MHQLVVDAYPVQHSYSKGRREVQTVAVCLMTLCLFIVDGVDPQRGPALHKQMVTAWPAFVWLDPPRLRGLMTVADVLAAADAAEHERLTWTWAREMWEAWAPHHPTIRMWNNQALA